MSNVSDLKAALVAEAADITDTIDRLECLALIDSWYDCKLAADALDSAQLASYTIADRSVTRAEAQNKAGRVDSLYAQIRGYLGRGGVFLSDQRSAVA